MSDISFEITKHCGVISEEKSGWRKELNMVAWNGRAPKFDLREWSPNHEKMSKGITLTREEAAAVAECLKKAFADPAST
ncbi:MAG: hypothetical protein LBT11_03500 [Treponema sp.]|nr:hypothetical protein [Treponema sp.]